MPGILFNPDVGARLNAEDIGGAGAAAAPWDRIKGDWFGAKTVFDGDSELFRSAKINEIDVLVVYGDVGNSQFGTAQILDYDDTDDTINANAAFVFEAADIITGNTTLGMDLIDPGFALVVYRDGGASSFGTAQILDLNTTTKVVTGNTVEVFNGQVVNNLGVAVLSTTSAAVIYFEDTAGKDLKIQILSLNTGTGAVTANEGNSIVLNTGADITNSAIKKISATSVVVSWRNNTTGVVHAENVTISGTTPTSNATLSVETVAADVINIEVISSSRILMSYGNRVMVLSLSGTTLSTNTAVTLSSFGNKVDGAMRAISATQFITAYFDMGWAVGAGGMKLIEVDDVTVTISNIEVGFDDDVDSVANVTLELLGDNFNAMVMYADEDNTDQATARIILSIN